MSDTKFWCFLEGDNTSFTVTCSLAKHITDLKEETKKELCGDFPSKNLTLWKPLGVIPVKPSDTLAERIKNLGPDFSQLAKKLEPADPIAMDFQNLNETSTFPQLDIIVQLPTQSKTPLNDDQRPAKRLRFSDSDPFDEGDTVTVPDNMPLYHTPSKPLAEVKNKIHEILQRYRPTMQMLVMKAGREPLISPWIPKAGSGCALETAFCNHIETLAIPVVKGFPSLLLHDLGSQTSAISQRQAEYMDGVFSLDYHTILINTAGSGKTRLGLHGLCEYWGFYGVVGQASDGIGSGDFWDLLSSLDDCLDYRRAQSRGSQNDSAALHMHEKVQHRVLQFLLARFLLLNLLIAEAFKSEEGLRPSDHRLLWVLLQARPTDILKKDAFMELAEALQISSVKDLKTQIKEEYLKLEPVLTSESVNHPATGQPTRRPLYCFLDEIQSTTAIRMGEYRSDDKKKERPLLRPIWQTMTEVLKSTEMLLILSGTALNESSLQNVLTSSVFKIRPYTIQRDIGAFDDPNSQRQYIEHYLPNEQSAARSDFLKRAWEWCRGRYRSTATLITLILATGPDSPHKILNKLVKSFTNFSPTDGEKWCAAEPDVSNVDIEEWNFDRMERRQIDVLCDILYGQMVYGSYALKPWVLEDDIKSFIEFGFARTRSGEHVIDEPLVVMAAWNWLDVRGHFSLLASLQREVGKHAPRKNAFEAYIAFYLRHVFEHTQRLNEVFSFRSDFARRMDSDLSWQTEGFELVTVSAGIPGGTGEQKISVVTPSSGPSSNVGFLAETNDDVLNWISENKECYAFCFPTESAGPDILFYVRSKATGRLLLVAVQAKNCKDVQKQTLAQGVGSVTPPFWKKSKGEKADEVSKRPLATAPRFFDALMKIKHSITIVDAPYPILRVFASWPADPKLERTLDPEKLNEGEALQSQDLHPLATLHLDNFNRISETIPRLWYWNNTEQVCQLS